MDFGQILDSKSYDQAKQTLWYHTMPRPYHLGTLPLFLGLFNWSYVTQFLRNFGKILDYKSYDQA